MHAQIVSGHLKGAAGTGAGLFKDQGHVFTGMPQRGHAVLFLFF